MDHIKWGVDLGGTKIEAAVYECRGTDITVRCRKRLPTESSKGYDHICRQIISLIQQVKDETQLLPSQIGFSTPGTVEPSTGLMKNCNTTCMNGQSMKTDLEKGLGVPITITNDANCFALAEARLGSVAELAPDAEVVFGVIMGSGCGGGVVIGGRSITGLHGIGGEWGHNFLDDSGEDCYCGSHGCNETIISGPALQRYYQLLSGEKKTMQEITALYQSGKDPHAAATLHRLFSMFGKAISVIINVLDPDAIVLGGGLANIDELYTLGVEEVKKHIFNKGIVKTPFLKPKLGDSAGVFGAGLA